MPERLDQACAALLEELFRWNRKINLTGHRDRQAAMADLILDSLALAPHVKGDRLLDIGSGAGFPGLVLALARPRLEVTLLEARGKRVSFQEHMIRTLGLKDRVRALLGRASAQREQDIPALAGKNFSTVTLKAVAGLEESLSLARPYLEPGGRILLPRGLKDKEQALALGLKIQPYQLPQPGGSRIIVIAD